MTTFASPLPIGHRAPCAEAVAAGEINDNAWFPPEGGLTITNYRALAICSQCPIRRWCLDEALKQQWIHDVGIWGGVTVPARRRIRPADDRDAVIEREFRNADRRARKHLRQAA